MKRISSELIGASTSLIILTIFAKSDSYGYEIIQKVKELSNDEIKWQEASIYPLLKKLEKGGMIKSYWKVGERPRKYYSLLPDGKEQLELNMYDRNLVQSVIDRLQKK